METAHSKSGTRSSQARAARAPFQPIQASSARSGSIASSQTPDKAPAARNVCPGIEISTR